MSSDAIKDAFFKVKSDIELLRREINLISEEIKDLKRTLNAPTDAQESPTFQQTSPTIPTDKSSITTIKQPPRHISTGNEGVPTDRQTNQQTDTSSQKFVQPLITSVSKVEEAPGFAQADNSDISNPPKQDKISQIAHVSSVLDSLDSIKKELRSKFKRLTRQEMLIFSTIYQLNEEGLDVDYSLIASKLGLSESSARDYVLKLVKKGVPIVKTKQNNKRVFLSVHENLKKIASLQAILRLREL